MVGEAQETFSLFLMGKKQMVTACRTMPGESSESVEKFLRFVIEQKLSWRIPQVQEQGKKLSNLIFLKSHETEQ